MFNFASFFRACLCAQGLLPSIMYTLPLYFASEIALLTCDRKQKSPNVVQIPQGPKLASLSGVCELLHVALVLQIVAGDG